MPGPATSTWRADPRAQGAGILGAPAERGIEVSGPGYDPNPLHADESHRAALIGQHVKVVTGWQPDRGKQQMVDVLSTGIPFDGVRTGGIDTVIGDACPETGAPLVPIVGADKAGFVEGLLTVECLEGLEGAAVTGPGSVGGAGVAPGVDILDAARADEGTLMRAA